MTRILVIDDQKDTVELLKELFRREGYRVDSATDGGGARRLLEIEEYDVVFTDLRLGYPHDGLELLEHIKRISPRTQVVIMTAFSSVESSVLALKGGAYDYITKPFKAEELLLLAARAAEKALLTDRVASLERHEGPIDGSEIIGSSPAMVCIDFFPGV